MAQLQRITRRNTTITRDPDGTTRVTLYTTDVVTLHPDGTVTLNTGGWRSTTTRTRMNQAAHQFGLEFGVSFAGGRATVRTRDGREFEFVPGVYGSREWIHFTP